jgi:lipoprotein signal peptidase
MGVLNAHRRFVWPAYNVADAALVVGVILLVLVLGRRPEPARGKARTRGSR